MRLELKLGTVELKGIEREKGFLTSEEIRDHPPNRGTRSLTVAALFR
jgi:hypothetical protein